MRISTLLFVLLFAVCGTAGAQVLAPKSAVVTAKDFASVGNGQYTGTLEKFEDYAQSEYGYATVGVGDSLLDGKAQLYQLLEVISRSDQSETARVRVLALSQPQLAPNGRGGVFRGIADGYIPQLPHNSGQVTPYLSARISLHNIGIASTKSGFKLDRIAVLGDTSTIIEPRDGQAVITADSTLAFYKPPYGWIPIRGGSGGSGGGVGDDWGNQVVITAGGYFSGSGTGGSPLTFNPGAINAADINNNGFFLTAEVDGSVTNELQDAPDVFYSESGTPSDVAEALDRRPTDDEVTAAIAASAAADLDKDPTNELYDDQELRDSLAAQRADFNALDYVGGQELADTAAAIRGDFPAPYDDSGIQSRVDSASLANSAQDVRIDSLAGLNHSGGSSNIAYNSNRPILRTWAVGTNIGGDSITDFFDYLYFAPPTITITNPSPTIREIGTTGSYTYTSTTTNPGNATLSNGRIERGGTSVATFGSALTGSYTFNWTPGAGSGSNANTYSIRSLQSWAGSGESGSINSPTRTLTAVYPVLYGVSSTDYSSSGALYGAMSKLVETEGNKTVSLNGSGFIYFAFPATWADTNLSKIVDGNGFDVTAAFTRYTRTVTSTGLANNWTTNYVVYKINNTTQVNASYQFIR